MTNNGISKKLSIRDYIIIITLFTSIIGVYFTSKVEKKYLEKRVVKLEKQLETNNLQVIKVEIKYIKETQKEMSIDIKEIKSLINKKK